MAYYNSGYYEDDHGEYNGEYSLTPYFNSYESAPVQDSVAYADYKFNEQQFFAYDPTPFFAAYDPVPSCLRIAYSASTLSEPMYIEYDPSAYNRAQTRFIVSYSTTEFNEPEFEEYDPTPYGGGYDLTVTYGKPLPPADDICYPRSTPDTNAVSVDGGSNGSIIVPFGKGEVDEQAAKPQIEKKPAPANDADQQPHEHVNGHGNSQEKTLDLYQGEESNEKYGDDGYPQSGYETGYGNGSIGEHGYEYGKVVPQIPSGYGLEAVDICESLFGYWPCLSRNGRRGNDCQEVADYGSHGNQWKETADYLFGSSNLYGGRRDDEGSYGNAIHGYERRYQEQPLYQQVEYVEDSFHGKVKGFISW